jgi:hypothetical protein
MFYDILFTVMTIVDAILCFKNKLKKSLTREETQEKYPFDESLCSAAAEVQVK